MRYDNLAVAALEIWQPGYTDHRIRDAADYVRHVEYLQTNPVRASLCSLPFDYQFSSATDCYSLMRSLRG